MSLNGEGFGEVQKIMMEIWSSGCCVVLSLLGVLQNHFHLNSSIGFGEIDEVCQKMKVLN